MQLSVDEFVPAMLRSIAMSASRPSSYHSKSSSWSPGFTGCYDDDDDGDDAYACDY